MAKKLNSMPDYTARMPKHPHDVSQSTAFTCCPGALSPVYYDMLHLGDEIHFSASEFVRLNPLEQQPLGDIDVHLDYFFVPLTVLYTPTSSLFYQTDDLVSSVFNDDHFTNESFPVYDFPTFLEEMFINEECQGSASPFDDVYKFDIRSFDCLGKSMFRMFDFLDMSPDIILDTIAQCIDPATNRYMYQDYPMFTPWFALAYQAIYQLYFRNDDRERKNYHYNIDRYFDGVPFYEEYGKKNIFQINYASRPKDYFNSVKVSPISSSVSLLSGSVLSDLYQSANTWLVDTYAAPSTSTGSEASLDGGTQVKTNSLLSTANIRQLFMVEKLLRVVGRAEKNYESQFLAHYGIKIPHDVMHNITHLGHDMITIKPEAVISQANTFNAETGQGSALGEIGGKGSGMLSGKKRNFKAPFHGVFMCISHVVPRKRYVLGLNKLHGLNTPNKFWQPEFDQKGMQPLFAYEACFNFTFNRKLSTRVGWQFAYEEFKRKSDRVMRAFQPTREGLPYSSQSVNTYAPWVMSMFPYSFLDSNGNSHTDYINALDPTRLLCPPTDLNINMIVPFNPAWPSDVVQISGDHRPWLLYQTDPFICDFNMYIKKVNGMSEYGEPEL